MTRLTIPIAAGASVGAGAGLLGAGLVVRRLGRRWGATDDEVAGALPGDEIIPNPHWQTTHAITIDAPARDIWPWLVQMGFGRGGWYVSQRLDRVVWRVENRSVDRIVPELQHLEVGDIVPDSPNETAHFRVIAIEPEQALVLHSIRHPLNGHWPDLSAPDPGPYLDFVWVFALREQRDGMGPTRLLLRARGVMQPRWLAVMLPVADLGDFLYVRQILRGIKRRVEAAAAAGHQAEAHAHTQTPAMEGAAAS